jgi:Lrp/AsnC family transcriptional regulator, leucine-responsive regulatory protein
VQLRCALGRCLLKTSAAEDFPEVVEVHKLSGSWCSLLRVRAASMHHLEGLFERLGEHGEMDSYIVLSTQYENRAVEPPAVDDRPVSEPAGWPRA